MYLWKIESCKSVFIIDLIFMTIYVHEILKIEYVVICLNKFFLSIYLAISIKFWNSHPNPSYVYIAKQKVIDRLNDIKLVKGLCYNVISFLCSRKIIIDGKCFHFEILSFIYLSYFIFFYFLFQKSCQITLHTNFFQIYPSNIIFYTLNYIWQTVITFLLLL